MDHTGLIYVIGFGIAATIFVFATILAAWVLSHRRRSPQKGLPYECGIDTIGDTWSRFGLAFYLFALLFVAFDVEIIFVYLWAVVIRAIAVPGIVMMGIFLIVLMFGEFYAWRKGDLRWH
jgi:NADH:ubiquinone oxidoreductase subunit 3 (subunit A)